jgi:pimeloyl-ACP methyl ester carboxylesterase
MYVTVANSRTYYRDEGAGPAILFLHGNPDSADLWNGVIERLRGQFRCLAPDLPGFGRSQAPPAFDGTLEQEAAWVDGLVTALAITEPLNLVGHDFGGHFGLAWAIRHPEKVRRIALSNTSFFSDYRWHGLGRALRTPILGEVVMAFMNESGMVRGLRGAAPRLPVEHIRRTARLYTPAAKKMALKLYRAADPARFHGWEDQLPTLTARVPTLVLWGDQDPFAARRIADRFGAAQVRHFSDYSHWLPVEAPDEFARALAAFFASGEPRPASSDQ